MKKVNLDILLITCVLCLSPILFGLYFYPELPEMVPIHFNINNNPDGFMEREIFVIVLPIIMMMVQVCVCILLDLKSKNTKNNNKSLFMYKLMIPFICIVLYVMNVLYAMQYGIDMFKVVLIILGVVFIAIGIDLPNNNEQYINFPKIKDEKVYKKTKKVFGVIFIIDGLLSLMATLFNSHYLIAIVLLLLIEAIALLTFVIWYNRRLEKKEKSGKQ